MISDFAMGSLPNIWLFCINSGEDGHFVRSLHPN